jgi:hypothetical protein
MNYQKRHKQKGKTSTDPFPEPDVRFRENPFNVPEYFFEDQQQQILDNTVKTSPASAFPKQQFLFIKPVILWPVAGIAALIFLFIAVYYTRDQSAAIDYFSGITMQQVLEESPMDLYMLDEDSFYDALSLSSLDWESSSQTFEFYLDTTISGESIQEYLIEENLSIELLNF